MGVKKQNDSVIVNQLDATIDIRIRTAIFDTNNKVSNLESKLEKIENDQETLARDVESKLSKKITTFFIALVGILLATLAIATAIIIFATSFLIDRSENYLREGMGDLKGKISQIEYDVKEIDSKLTEAKYHDHATSTDRYDNSTPNQMKKLEKPLKKTK